MKSLKNNNKSGQRSKDQKQIMAVSRNYPLPLSFRTKLRYAQEVNFNPGAGSFATNVFAASSLYDPDNTGTGHQPYGFDQLCSSTGLYDQFLVLGARCRVHMISRESTTVGFIALQLTDTNSVTASEVAQVMEQPLTEYSIVPVTSACLPITLESSYDAAKFYGVSQAALRARTDLMGSFSGNPAENAWFVIFVTGLLSGDLTNTPVLVDIEYDVLFQEPRKLGMS